MKLLILLSPFIVCFSIVLAHSIIICHKADKATKQRRKYWRQQVKANAEKGELFVNQNGQIDWAELA